MSVAASETNDQQGDGGAAPWLVKRIPNRGNGETAEKSSRPFGINPSPSTSEPAHNGQDRLQDALLDEPLVEPLDEPLSLIGPSPWSRPSPAFVDHGPRGLQTTALARPGPLGADAYWRTAFAAELTDSIIMRTLTHRPSPLFGGHLRPSRRRMPPHLYNRLGAIGLAPLAMLMNAGLRAMERLGA